MCSPVSQHRVQSSSHPLSMRMITSDYLTFLKMAPSRRQHGHELVADLVVFIQVPQRKLKASMAHILAHLNTIRGQEMPTPWEGDRHLSEIASRWVSFPRGSLAFSFEGTNSTLVKTLGHFSSKVDKASGSECLPLGPHYFDRQFLNRHIVPVSLV